MVVESRGLNREEGLLIMMAPSAISPAQLGQMAKPYLILQTLSPSPFFFLLSTLSLLTVFTAYDLSSLVTYRLHKARILVTFLPTGAAEHLPWCLARIRPLG